MTVLNKYGVTFDDFIKKIDSYYKESNSIPAAAVTDAEIRNSPQYKQWLADNANPLMTEEENLEYYKQCKL